MRKYHLNVSLHKFDPKNAADKAIRDCTTILTDEGYQSIEFMFTRRKPAIVLSLIKLIVQSSALLFTIKPNSLILTQYPIIGLNRFFKYLSIGLKAKKCYLACVIHDLNSLRYQESDHGVNAEVGNLNVYDAVISHNAKMTEWLKIRSLKSSIVDLQIFDYLSAGTNEYDRLNSYKHGDRDVVFAGSLGRGAFIYNLHAVAKDVRFTLYGPDMNGKTLEVPGKVCWKGSFAPERLVQELEGNFGLIWDGDDTEQCGGQFGGYIAYNNPHKISLYLVAGLPVILPAKSALSNFVLDNDIGVTINQLSDINDLASEIDPIRYEKMLSNIGKIRDKLKDGYFFRAALKEIEEKAHATRVR